MTAIAGGDDCQRMGLDRRELVWDWTAVARRELGSSGLSPPRCPQLSHSISF